MLTSSAQAQQAAEPASPSTEASDGPSEILVTGTRIARPDLASNSPLTTISDKEIRYQGVVNAETLLARMPQFTPDANDNVSNGADGSAQINLRNLGSNRVLTLINGQRILSSQATDINFVPTALIERVDVVTGGASAVYGSDAMSGVVNFVLRDHLDGFRLDAQTIFAQHTNDNAYVRGLVSAKGYQLAPRSVIDGGKQDINGAFGKTFADGRAKIMLYGGYRHTEPVQQSTRDYSSCALNAASQTNLVCGGSSNTTLAPSRRSQALVPAWAISPMRATVRRTGYRTTPATRIITRRPTTSSARTSAIPAAASHRSRSRRLPRSMAASCG